MSARLSSISRMCTEDVRQRREAKRQGVWGRWKQRSANGLFCAILLPGAVVLSNLICPFEKLASLVGQVMSTRSQVSCTLFQFPRVPLYFFAGEKSGRAWLCRGICGWVRTTHWNASRVPWIRQHYMLRPLDCLVLPLSHLHATAALRICSSELVPLVSFCRRDSGSLTVVRLVSRELV